MASTPSRAHERRGRSPVRVRHRVADGEVQTTAAVRAAGSAEYHVVVVVALDARGADPEPGGSGSGRSIAERVGRRIGDADRRHWSDMRGEGAHMRSSRAGRSVFLFTTGKTATQADDCQ